MMSTIISVFNGEVIESRVDVPVTLHSPFQEKRASSSANQIITSPLPPITPDKGLNMVVDVPVALLSPFTERTASSSAIQIMTSPLFPKTPDKGLNPVVDVPVALLSPFTGKTASNSANLFFTSPLTPITLDKGSNSVAPLTPGTDKTSQNCQLHETTKLPGKRLADGNIQENCMTKKVPFPHTNSSFVGVCPRCLDSARDEVEVEDEETQGIDLNKIPRTKAEMRKKHRPKVIQEGKLIKSPSPVTPKAAENKERPIPKRTYVRKKKSLNSSGTLISITEENKVKLIPMKTYVRKGKALNSSESLSGKLGETMGLCSSTAVKTVNQRAINASKSVRRRLDFSAEGEATAGCHESTASDVKVAAGETFNGNTTVGSREFTRGLNAVTTKLPAEVTFDLNRSPDQVLDENPTPSAQLSGTEVVRKHEGGSDSSIVENDMIMQSDQEQFVSGSHSDIVTRDDDIEKTGTKRPHDQIEQHYSAKESPRDICFVHGYNETNKTSLCQERSSLIPYLPVVYKRRRTERGQTWRCNRAQWSATFDRLQQSELILAFDLTQRVTRKRSKLHTRSRKPSPISGAEDCSHLLWSPEWTEGSHVTPENNKYEPQTCMDALFADTRFKITTKKRRKKEHVRLVSSMSDMEQECDVASSRFGFLGQPFVPLAVVPYMDPMEVLLDKMKHMKVGGEHIKAIAEASNALIPYGGGRMMIPYGRLFDAIKKQRPRAKVDLDPETNRIWNLLMGRKSDDKADGVDMDKEKWWEEERHVFRGRTDAFIARMHLIQGDRRFSKWNGSIVDSVVGVFLTQNVSDHLSSSAFMSLAARFPLRSRDNSKESNEEKVDTSKEQGDGSIPACGETIMCQEKMSIPETIAPGSTGAYNEEKEASDVSSSLESISHEPSLVYDEQLAEVLPKEIDTDFSVENTHEEVEILTETQHCGKQTEYPSSCIDFKFNLKNEVRSSENELPERKKGVSRAKKVNSETKMMFDWEGLREEVFANGANNERSSDTMDSLDWEQVRNADVNEISMAIRERGMNNVLAQRIKDFLNRLVEDHGSIDLEWLRNVPPDKAKEYLLSIRGLGLKSVECVRLLTLHHLAFPVDTNVGRVSVRLGWVPLQPLPESLQLHLLELYPMIEHIQKYLWPRLCTLDQQTLYELHYQMITFGKVFCTKTKPNCNACPMRGECKHFASAFASARLSLPAPEESRLVASRISSTLEKERSRDFISISLPQLKGRQLAKGSISNDYEPIIEEPATPEQASTQTLERDIEDAFYEDPEEIPTIKLNSEEFAKNLENYMQENQVEMQDGDASNALVTITADTASLPMPKLKNVSRLRTEHQVYELPDLHPLLEGMDKRVPGDPCPYLLAIWAAGETSQSIEPPQSCCRPQDSAILCDGKTCFACNSAREVHAQTVRGTILERAYGTRDNRYSPSLFIDIKIPCRTAMRGSFPLNGTYFQVNEVFADHSSSRVPIDVPRKWIWNLPRRTVFFGTSVSTIFKGLTMEGIQQCFWRGFVCVRGFDRASRVPRPLYARLHFPPSKAVQNKKMPAKEE